jgi:FixJ family two-component response regulator
MGSRLTTGWDITMGTLISIVDDDAGMRSSLDGLIRSLGYEVAVFDSAEAFLRSPASHESHCVISDVQMPGGMSGIELLKAVKASASEMPVILMSAFVNADSLAEAKAVGAHCTLRKPFNGEVLVSCVEEALAR